MKNYLSNKNDKKSGLIDIKTCSPGFSSLLTVISVGLGMLLILVSMYDRTVESQNTQKDHMMRADYQQREEAFLRALTNIVPNHAIICMQDNSWDDRADLRWRAIIDNALDQSNAREALSATRASELGIDDLRSGNTIDSDFDRDVVVTESLDPPSTNNADISAGINIPATTEYPPPLELNVSQNRDGRWPIVSFDKRYGNSAIGWVDADVALYPHFNLVDTPSLHFNYKSGDKMIAKHNWWTFNLSMADQDEDVTNLTTRTKEYIISLYEIPSQLSVNGASFTTLGAHSDGTAWSNINISGGIFAQRVRTEGTFTSDSISSRQGVELSDATTVNGTVTGSSLGSDVFASQERELIQSRGQTFPISSAANGGRVAFIPINRGLDFYDRFASNLTNNSSASTNAVSSTSWDYYSLGAQQCVMRLDVIDVVGPNNPTPTSIRFTYIDSSAPSGLEQQVYTKGVNWPDPSTTDGLAFPFHTDMSATGYTCLVLHTSRLSNHLATIGGDPASINHSISINPDYVNNSDISKPGFPSDPNIDFALMLRDSDDLTPFTSGFSLVTNLLTIIGDDFNITPATPPAGVIPTSGTFFPPFSLFAPEKRWGDSATPMRIEIDGQLSSLARGDTPTNIGDLKSGSDGDVVADNITANLREYNHPAELPPINIMNWMIVIQEVNPAFAPTASNP